MYVTQREFQWKINRQRWIWFVMRACKFYNKFIIKKKQPQDVCGTEELLRLAVILFWGSVFWGLIRFPISQSAFLLALVCNLSLRLEPLSPIWYPEWKQRLSGVWNTAGISQLLQMTHVHVTEHSGAMGAAAAAGWGQHVSQSIPGCCQVQVKN